VPPGLDVRAGAQPAKKNRQDGCVVLPILQNMASHQVRQRRGRLVLTPTRELAAQVAESSATTAVIPG